MKHSHTFFRGMEQRRLQRKVAMNPRERELQEARNQFLRALSAGQANVVDRFNVPIKDGDKVLFHPGVDLIAEVASVVPIMDPRAQPGQCTVTLTFSVPIGAFVNQPQPALIVMSKPDAQPKEDPKPAAFSLVRPDDPQENPDGKATSAPAVQTESPAGDQPDPSQPETLG